MFEKGGERLGDEESSEEEKEVTPASILVGGEATRSRRDRFDLPEQAPLESPRTHQGNRDLGGVERDS